LRAIGLVAASAALTLAAGCAATDEAGPASGYHLIPGTTVAGRQPDGNTVILDAPKGLIVVDTGRHMEHQAQILEYARQAGKPIAAIVNTHWHLDHSGGNAEIRQAHPGAQVYTSNAIYGALSGFLANSKKEALDYLANEKVDAETEAEIRGDIAAFDERVSLLPAVAVTASDEAEIAGRRIQVNLASHAATEGDVWLYDEGQQVAIVGDLVVAHMPYMDTACPEGWRKALEQVAASPFTTLIPGHGAPMNRSQFETWRTAFNNLLDCADGAKTEAECTAGWRQDAAMFLDGFEQRRTDGALAYYMRTRLRSKTGRSQYCPAAS
jgi:glyoxylase-like metal-dependent hydrolase (beta-lactamase superfamily II)